MAGSEGWQIRESNDFERGVAQCGGHKFVDEIIAPIIRGLHRRPHGFQNANVSGIRFAKTKLRLNGPDVVLSHIVWFRIEEEERSVTLLWVEIAPPEDMGFDDEWEVPF